MKNLDFKKWDKKESVNGVAARTILSKNARFVNNTIYLVFDKSMPSRILRIEDVNIIRANGGYTADVSDDAVMAAFVEGLNTPPKVDVPTSDNELAIMEALATIYEQNLQILNK